MLLISIQTDVVSDNCNDPMLCSQSVLGLRVSGMCIQRHIVGKGCFYSTFTEDFFKFNVAAFFKVFLNGFVSFLQRFSYTYGLFA